jgi:hypothetical protein
MVGDGDTVGIAGQVVENMFRSAEWRLGVDDPLVGKDLAQKVSEALDSGQFLERAMEL